MRAQTETLSKTEIKVGEIKIIAIFDLIERLLQMSYDTMYDLGNIDAEYRKHIDICKQKNSKQT